MVCENCGNEIQSGAAFCQICGQKVDSGKKFCINCGREIAVESSFCPFCGADQSKAHGGKSKKGNKKKKKWLFILGALLLAFIILVCAVPTEDSTDGTAAPVFADKVSTPAIEAPEPTPDPYTYRDDGQIETYVDEDGNNWEYFYNNDGVFKYRVKTIENPAWHFSEEAQTFSGFTVHPCEFDEDIENCIGFDVSFAITHVDYGHVYGDYVVYVLEPEISSKYQDEGRITVKENETATKTIEFSKPKTVRALALRMYIADSGGASWSSNTQISNLKIIDYNYQ